MSKSLRERLASIMKSGPSKQENHGGSDGEHRTATIPDRSDGVFAESTDSFNGDRKFRKSQWPSTSGVSELSYENSGLSDGKENIHRMEDEAIPNIEYYVGATSVKRVISRPTLRQLHDPARRNTVIDISIHEPDAEKPIQETNPHNIQHKFGWIRGVLIRCILSILGTLLYLRMGWIAGRAGLGFATLIVAISAAITLITALSMSALCTNGEIQAGGAYFMLSVSYQ